MDKTVLTLAVDSTQVGTAAAAFDRMVGAGNAAAATAGKVTTGAALQGRAITTQLIPAATKARTAYGELGAAAERLDPRLAQPKTILPLAQAKPQPAQVQADAVEPKPKRARKTVTPDAADASAAGVTKLGAESKKAKTSLDGLAVSARGTGNALVTLTTRAKSAADAVRSISAAPIKIPTVQNAAFDVAPKVNALNQVAAAMALAAAQAAKTSAAVADANRVISTPIQIRATAAAPSARTPLASAAPLSAVTGQRIPTGGNIAQLAGDAGRAQTAVDKLTGAARNQRPVLSQLAPAAAATAASYRQLASTPITLAAPQGLSSAAAALANAATQANNARAAIGALNAVRPPASPSAAAAPSAAGARGAMQQNNALAQSARQAAFQQQQLAFQLNDFFVQVASGGSPLTALIQQGSQLSGTFGGMGNAVRAVTGLITPMRLAMGGAAGAVGALALAFLNGQKQSAAFANALLLSGNYAGQTEGKFNALTREIAAHGDATVTAAREAGQALLATGEIGPQVFAAATEAAALYALATGKTAEDVAKDFAAMSRAPTRFAAEANRSLNFITAAQYQSIKAFEENGRAADAQGVIYDALKARLNGLSNNLPYLDKRLHELKDAWSKMWDAASGFGRADTIEQQLSSVEKRAAMFQAEQAKLRNLEPGLAKGKKPATTASAAIDEERRELLKRQFREGENAFAEANRAEINKAAIAADAVIEGYTKRAKAAEGYKQKLDELERGFLAKENAGVPLSDADKNIARGQLKKDFAPARAAGSGEASQILRAQLDRDLNGFQQALERERDAFAFHNRFLQGEYQAGGISLRAFYDDKRQTAAAAVSAELSALEQERARLEQFKRATKDPSEKVQTQNKIDDNLAQQDKVRVAADRDIELSNQEEAASFKALNDQVTNYRANLLQMQGDEAGAARLRAQSAIAAAQVLSKQAAGLPGAPTAADVFEEARRVEVQIQYNEVQRQASILINNSARAEEAYGLAAEQSGKTLAESERGIFEIRSQELAQLGALTAKAKELAEASVNPQIKQFAADLALEYAKAAAAIDPALNRLRDANRELAAGLANTAGQGPNAIAQEYTRRRLEANDDIKRQRDEYSRKIDMLEGYLATTQDKNDKARLRERIKEAEGKRDGVKGESRGSSVLKAINDAVLQPMAEQVFQTVNKLLITDPLQKYLEGQLKGLTEGDGMLAGILKDALGIQADPKDAALAMQTAAIDSNRDALNALTQAAQSAAAALNAPIPAAGDPLAPGVPAPAAFDAQAEATDTLASFSKTAATATSDVARLATAAGVGGNAMSRLPAIVSLFQSAAAAMSTSSAGGSGGGIFGAIASLFSGTGTDAGMGYEEAVAATGIFHQGGVVGSPPATRTVAQSVFAGAQKYHSGGIAGRGADKLKPNEVAAILMGGPKGTREEVITADDPRHRDNLGMNALAKIMAESKHEGMRVRGARELGGPVSANGMYRVNEKGPELLQVAGKQYLMTGSQGGSVTPNGAGGKPERAVEVHNHFAISGPTNHASQSQIAGHAARGVRRGMRNT